MPKIKIKEEEKVFDVLLKRDEDDCDWKFICPYCHHELFDIEDTDYCPFCGERISRELKEEKK